ncbi:MAG: GNVR domain-containing protein [Bryobacteraceae bacterium]
MQATTQPDYLSVPRRALDVEDYVDILRRHWTWIVGPAFAGLVVSVVVAFLWPNTYISYAVMRITPSQVSDRIVPTNFNLRMAERLNTMLQDVTSRSKLIDMIKKFNLYPQEQAKRPLEDVVEDMRSKVKINVVEAQRAPGERTAGSAFHISFSYPSRTDAQKVVGEIVNAFMSQNIVDRRAKSRITTEFLSEEVKTAKAELEKIEGELTSFKVHYAGSLPDELQSNLQLQQSYQQQLGALQEILNRNQQNKMMLETNLQNLRAQQNAVTVVTETETAVAGPPRNERLMEMERRVTEAESQLNAMREQLKENHPDLRTATLRVETIKKERDRLAAQDAKDAAKPVAAAIVKKSINPQAVRTQADIEAQMKSTKASIEGLNIDSADRVKMQSTLMEALKSVNGRIQSNPLTAGEYAKLTRDYGLAKQHYDELNSKKSNSEVANRLEDRSAGENLEVLDPPSLPLKPSEPNRLLIVGAGVGIGLLLGLFLAGAQEVKNTTMKGLKDVRAYSTLTILSSIPLLENALLVRRKRRLTWLAWSSATIIGVVVMSGSVYYYYWGH